MTILNMAKGKKERALTAYSEGVMMKYSVMEERGILEERYATSETNERHLTRVSKSGLFIAGMMFVLFCAFASCSPEPSDDPIPPATFPDKVINLNLPDNIALRSKGHAQAYGDIGNRGVIVYCVDVGVYHAYEQNCSYTPNEACANVNIDVSGLFMIDHCCNSTFDFNTGMPSGGVAWRPLRQYRTTFNGTDLVITDEVVE